MTINSTRYWALGGIVAFHLAIGTLYAIYTPPWQAPDEPAHYNAIAQVAREGCCPVIAPGDWNSEQLEALKAAGFPEDADLSAIQYEDHQPPLYYFMGAAVHWASGGSLLALRLMSLALGSGAIVAAFFAVSRLFPRQPILALSAASFAAFLPQHVAILASVNNDSLAGLVLGILIVVSLTYLGNPIHPNPAGEMETYPEPRRPHAAALGWLAGVAFLTKLTLYLPAVVMVAAVIIGRWRIEQRKIGWLAEQTLWAAGMALVFGAGWWIRNAVVYGWPDLFGLMRHDQVVVGQLRTADYIAQIGTGAYLQTAALTVFHSFFGKFGWMGVPMPQPTYDAIAVFMIAALAGLFDLAWRLRHHVETRPAQRAGMIMLGGGLLAALAGLIQYNFSFVQFQGRYLYPGLIPIAALVAAGLWGWAIFLGRGRGTLHERWGATLPAWWGRGETWERALAWLPLAALAWMPALSLWALFKWIIPNLK